MAKVLLLAAAPSENNHAFIPYALLFLRSALERRGHEVALVDLQLGREAYGRLRSELERRPDVLGVSLFSGPGVSLAKEASRLCRRLSPATRVVWGGIVPTISPELVLAEESVDFVLRYEAEESLPALVDALERGGELAGVPNLAYRRGGELVLPEPPEAWLDVSDFAPIDFAGVGSPKYVFRGFHYGKRVVPIHTSRGCPYGCTFCYNQFYNHREWRSFPVSWTLDTIDGLVETYRADGLMAMDDNFFVDHDRAREILGGARARGHRLGWWIELRVDQILDTSLEELVELRDLGLAFTYVGVESGSDRVLKLFNKRITVGDVREANRRLARAGISACYTFIVGAPEETKAETLQTVDLAMELLAENPLASLWQLNQFTPYPGTPLYRRAIQRGFEPYRTLEDWDVGWTLRDRNLSSTTLPESSMETLRYASLFQKPDPHLVNQSLAYRVVYKSFRAVFAERMRRHLFAPFVDTWAVSALYRGTQALDRFRLGSLSREGSGLRRLLRA